MNYYLGLGSNLDAPDQQLEKARQLISADPGIVLLRSSSVIKTAPYGWVEQPDFSNQVLEISSEVEPQRLMQRLLAIEAQMGRIRTRHWGPRVIDIDLLMAGDLVLDLPSRLGSEALPALQLPHPDLQNRLFVLQPLMELCPQDIHPKLHKTISELYYALIEMGGPI